jgi:hypothetical protein
MWLKIRDFEAAKMGFRPDFGVPERYTWGPFKAVADVKINYSLLCL